MLRRASTVDYNKQVASQLRKWRKIKERTLQELALLMGTTPQTVQRLETGNMTLSVEWLRKYADALDKSVGDFFPSSECHVLYLEGRKRGREEMRKEMIGFLHSVEEREKAVREGEGKGGL